MSLLPSRWSSAIDQWKRDARAVRRRFAGEPASPLVRVGRPHVKRGQAVRELVIARVARETADATTLVLVDPGGAPFAFEPGQFFTVHAEGGALRNYSASNAPGHRELH